MNNIKRLGGFTGRFALAYLVFYIAVGILFLNLQNALPLESRVALDFYEPYNIGFDNLVAQFLLGVFLALVLYPFYDLLVRGERGLLILFTALWGVALLGNLEPKPGSIEGMIYTHITFLEHFLVIIAGAVQFICFALVFVRWEQRLGQGERSFVPSLNDRNMEKSGASEEGESSWALSQRMDLEKDTAAVNRAGARPAAPGKWLRGYALRFTLLHVIIYLIVGSLFYEISGYEEALATMEAFELWRNLESLGMVMAVFFGQIGRGAFLALVLYAFYNTYMSRKNGWLLLFGLLLGLKVFPALFTPFESLGDAIIEAAVGLPEILAQTLVFSLVFYAWEKRRNLKKESLAA